MLSIFILDFIFIKSTATWKDLLFATREKFGLNGVSFFRTNDSIDDNIEHPKINIEDHDMKISDIGCYEFDIESNADFDNRKADGINIRTVISHGRDRIIINSGKPKDLLIDEEFEVKLDHKRFVSEILLFLHTKKYIHNSQGRKT